MIKNRRNLIIGLLALCVAVAFLVRSCMTKEHTISGTTKVIHPVVGDVVLTVVTTGVVEPQNRLEIKSSMNGRIETILAREGDHVKEGDILAWMSSTERAALIDAARSQGEATLSYWEEVYKKTPIISPIDGEVIVRSVEPGQTVTTSDAVLVLSDRLVVSAQFDETDVGRVKIGQEACMALDAYPDLKIGGTVDHIAYESEIVNNVTIYNVDILPKKVPEIFRSGMSVTVEVIEKKRTGVMTIPSEAIHYDGERQFVLLKTKIGKTVENDITVGLNDERTAEVISGLSAEDTVVVHDTAYLPKRKSTGTNPFMPSRKR
jgi:macrolide-specific efflux system membrane fusion protein